MTLDELSDLTTEELREKRRQALRAAAEAARLARDIQLVLVRRDLDRGAVRVRSFAELDRILGAGGGCHER
jgi:hypothetical protein